jgi:mannose-6-phosphate isomerase-like protein (cupin superfamily)
LIPCFPCPVKLAEFGRGGTHEHSPRKRFRRQRQIARYGAIRRSARRAGPASRAHVSLGQATPPGVWLDQNEAEWAILLRGAAKLSFEGENAARDLKPGDYVNIPAHCRHRVEWTTPDEPTIWLALHYAA